MKKEALIFPLFLILILFVLGAPIILFINQSPADIDAFNLFGHPLNVTYNISNSDINTSTVLLYYKINSSKGETNYYVNGTETSGYQSASYSSNESSTFLFTRFDNNIYPATYNFPERAMELANKSAFDLDAAGQYIKINFLNVSNGTAYNVFEIYAQNQTSTSDSLRIYYCNSSHTNQNPANSGFCTNFYNLDASIVFNHTHGVNSFHHTIPMAINTTTGRIGDVVVTSSSNVLVRGRTGTNAWNIYYISNVSRTNAIQVGTNSGTDWTNFSGTVDAHIHQYNLDTTLNYYICANDTSGNQNCSSLRTDLIELGGIAPSSPNIYNPINQYYRLNLTINYTEALSPNLYAISFYNISLVNFSDDYITTIIENNSMNLSYIFDTTLVADGEYNIHVKACDINNLCSTGESDDFFIDNTYPIINSISSSPSVNSASIIYTTNESTNYTLYYGTTTSTSASVSSSTNSTSQTISLTGLSSSTTYYYNISACDLAGNCNLSSQYSFATSAETVASSGSGSGGSSYPTVHVNEEQLKNIFTYKLSKNWRVVFNLKNETHRIEISEVTDTNMSCTLYSEPKKITVGLNEEYRVDVDDDGYYDLLIKLNSIENKNAYIEMKLIVDKTPEEKIVEEEIDEIEIKIIKEIEKNKKEYFWGFIFAVIFVIILLNKDKIIFRVK